MRHFRGGSSFIGRSRNHLTAGNCSLENDCCTEAECLQLLRRDGVGEGQIHLLLEVEVAEIKKLLVEYAEANDSPPITLTYIVVSKRINTRFFASTSQTVDNPPSGTVVDNVVTLPER